MTVTAPTNGPDTCVIWEYTTGPAGTPPATLTSWMVTIKPILTLASLAPGMTLYVRYRVVTTKGYGDWSQLISKLIT